MERQADDSEFIKQLRDEKIKAQETRSTYTLQKLTYATALLGIGSLSISFGQASVDLLPVLFLVPFVALIFDFYVLGEDFSVKRLGLFLGYRSPTHLEQKWEKWITDNRDPFAPWAMPLLTTLLTLGAGLLLWRNFPNRSAVNGLFSLWLVASLTACWGLFLWYRHLRRRAQRRAENAFGSRLRMPDRLMRLREATTNADHLLEATVYEEIKAWFLSASSQAENLDALQQLAPEYGEPEFLLCVDAAGAPKPVKPGTLDDYRHTVEGNPSFSLWFQETAKSEGQTALLAARWLCHLLGLRHRTTELFIDHPTLADHTLVQVRGLDKFEAPACFDLPTAGHVVGLDTTLETLLKEAKEELNLDPGDILELSELGSYSYTDEECKDRLCNVEFRTVYRCRLANDAWDVLRFPDGEVAAIAFFSLPTLQELVTRDPGRVASGLAQSLRMYL